MPLKLIAAAKDSWACFILSLNEEELAIDLFSRKYKLITQKEN